MCLIRTDLSSPSVSFFLLGTGKQNLFKKPQNKALKIMTNSRWHHSASPLYQKLQLLKFNDIVKLQLANIMHSVHNNNISNYYFGFSEVEKFHHYCTRASTKSNFVQTSARPEKGISTISFSGPKILREIPSDLKNLSNNSFKYQYNNSFKYQYKIRLLNRYTE